MATQDAAMDLLARMGLEQDAQFRMAQVWVRTSDLLRMFCHAGLARDLRHGMADAASRHPSNGKAAVMHTGSFIVGFACGMWFMGVLAIGLHLALRWRMGRR